MQKGNWGNSASVKSELHKQHFAVCDAWYSLQKVTLPHSLHIQRTSHSCEFVPTQLDLESHSNPLEFTVQTTTVMMLIEAPSKLPRLSSQREADRAEGLYPCPSRNRWSGVGIAVYLSVSVHTQGSEGQKERR